jgi:lipopolysaccharide/colanic/teichoic acid biosynthesis glycosyltransferase
MDAKRVIDLVGASVALALATPVIGAAAIAIRLDSKGPILYRSVRVGVDGELFRLCKLRSMRDSASGSEVTAVSDPRVTRIGRLLRRTKVDELPQLVNVLLGQMSLVGPRPEVPKFVALYTRRQRGVLRVRPGITSPASLAFRNEEAFLPREEPEQAYVMSLMPAKLEMDLDYVCSQSLMLDLRILLMTARALVRK